MSNAPTGLIGSQDNADTFDNAEDMFPTTQLVRLSRSIRILSKVLLVLLCLALLAMIFAPWQQTITGSGDVVAYDPMDRRQTVEAPVKGKIIRFGEGIQENAFVKEGEVILELQDIDPNLTTRLESQLLQSQRNVEAAQEHVEASKRQLEFTRTIVDSYVSQVAAFESVRTETVGAAEQYISMAESKVAAEKNNLIAAEAALRQSKADYSRQKELHEEGLASQLKMQLAEQKFHQAEAKVDQAKSYVEAALSEVAAKRRERDAKEREAQAKIDSANAVLRKARGDIAKGESDVAKSNSEISKAEKELADSQIKLSRQRSQLVRAPRDGYIVRLVANQGSGLIKEGQALFEIVPQAEKLAAQIWVDGNDVPLLSEGRHVRLQFEGWPAVQFSGWPSVAVGTFGGKIALIDSTDSQNGKFRVLVLPDENEPPWPEYPYLRQGVRTNAWVLLDQVRLGYEVWRRMNGFPPSLKSMDSKQEGKDSKTPKIKI
ncbi:HlyD family secretion protein [Bythopirellula polymerisocia]|uniref:Multidrug resistance protein MdtN n=1 Tax=Bythopirellula polymerisocia TaxID=2528003 RepID=A0A5C6CD44_9BACT|nr:HlyD family efflux transporter periplasmic adaptor subunit [Bythopirellula polymerisocia]TWU21975.1 multidrug resistance protein MdtN [Bythopirellula polymerisocia]